MPISYSQEHDGMHGNQLQLEERKEKKKLLWDTSYWWAWN